MVALRSRWVLLVSVVLLLGATVTVPAIRTPILRTAGWTLVVDEPLEPADIIVVAIDAADAGLLEAADLFHRGIATRVALFADPPNDVDLEFIRRGVPYEDVAARNVRLLRSLGVSAIETIPRPVAGTEDQGAVLHDWCAEHRFRSIVVVTSADHSRRLRRVLRRTMQGEPPRVMIRNARHAAFHPDRWWHTRAGIRDGIEEAQKLLLDIVRHPTS
jgi:hypothetical protein